MSEFNPYDHKSLPQELNNNLSPFAAAVGAPGGSFMAGARSSISSSFSSLQLSSTTPSRFSYLHDSKNGCCLQVSGSATATATLVTSATALLQKAAQIGATSSSVGGLNSALEMPHSDEPDMVGTNMGMYGQMMMMKEQENCGSISSSFVVQEKGRWQPVSRFSSRGGESEMMTLDLLGEGGWRLRQLQGNQHFELQNFHGDSTDDKPIFEF